MADLKHSVAICTDDNRRIGIEEVYTLSGGKKINRPGIIEYIRKLGRENKLECECGCGGKLMLKAGEQMLMTQHFAMKPGQSIIDCRSTVETDYTRLCKGVLKCWVDTAFSLEAGEIRYAYPYSKIEAGERRYEFTFYVPKCNYGVIFSKTSTIEPDKLSYFAKRDNVGFLAVAPVEDNIKKGGQYPEYAMRMQDAQGFCAFLNANEDYSLSKLSVVRYELSYNRRWSNIVVVDNAPLSRFSVSPDGKLLYDGEVVIDMVNECVTDFKERDLLCAKRAEEIATERKAKEEERQQQIEQQRKEYENRWAKFKEEKDERERLRAERAAESKKRRELANQKRIADEEAEKARIQEMIDAGEKYLLDFPAKKAIYDIVKKSYGVEGMFKLMRRDSNYTQGRVLVLSAYVWFDSSENNIVIKDRASDGKIYLIHLQHDAGEKYRPSELPSGGYSSFPFYARKNSVSDILNMFTSFYKCLGGGTIIIDKVDYGCKLKDVNPELVCFDYEKGICGKPDSLCSYRINNHQND